MLVKANCWPSRNVQYNLHITMKWQNRTGNMRYATLKEFYPYYLSEHSNPTNRRLHIAGTGGLIALAVGAAITASPLALLAVPVVGYGFAWVGHFFFERNKPATFKYPAFSLICDFLMFRDVLLGRLPK